MPEIIVANPTNFAPGAMVTPPSMIRDSIKAQVDRALADLPADKTGAMVAVANTKGVNLAFAHRDPSSGWEVVAWVGKSWSDKRLDVGAQVKKTW